MPALSLSLRRAGARSSAVPANHHSACGRGTRCPPATFSRNPRRLRVQCSGPFSETEKVVPPPAVKQMDAILSTPLKESIAIEDKLNWKKAAWEVEEKEEGFWSSIDKDSIAYSSRVGLSVMLLSPLAWDGWLQETITHDHGWWPMLTALICSEKTLGSTINKGMRRALGTLIGCGSVALIVPLARPWLDLGLDPRAFFSLSVLAFTSYIYYYRKYNQSWDYAFFVTVLSFNLTLLDSYQEGWSIDAPIFRMLMTGLGATTALGIASLLSPRSSENSFFGGLATATSEAAAFSGKLCELCTPASDKGPDAKPRRLELEMDELQYRQGLDKACRAHFHSVVSFSTQESRSLDLWRHELGFKDALARIGFDIDAVSSSLSRIVMRSRPEVALVSDTVTLSEGGTVCGAIRTGRMHRGLPKMSIDGNSAGAHLRTLTSVMESMRIQSELSAIEVRSGEVAEMLHNCQRALQCIAEHVKHTEVVPDSLQQWHLKRLQGSTARVQEALQALCDGEVTCQVTIDQTSDAVTAESALHTSKPTYGCSAEERVLNQQRVSLLCLAAQLPALVEQCFNSSRSLVQYAL